MKQVKSLIKEIAVETGISTHDVEMIIRSEFKLLLTEAQKDSTEAVRLIYLGVFGVKPKRRQYLKAKKKE